MEQGKILITILIIVLVLVILAGGGYYLYYAGYLDGLLGRSEAEPVVVEQVSVTDVVLNENANVETNENANENLNVNGLANENVNAPLNANTNINANANVPANTNAPTGQIELTKVTYNECFFLSETSATCGTKTIFFAQELGREQLDDEDADGIPDILETLFGTTISLEDSDKDGYGDMEEILNGYNPLGTGDVVFAATTTEQWVEMNADDIAAAGIILP